MSTHQMILFFILCTYHILNICESHPDDPWKLEDEENFKGKFCEKNSIFFSQLCNRYAIGQITFIWAPEKLNNLSCSKNELITLWSKTWKQDEKVERDILECNYYTAGDYDAQQLVATVGLSRGKNEKDAAEYHYNETLESWIPIENHSDMLDGLTES